MWLHVTSEWEINQKVLLWDILFKTKTQLDFSVYQCLQATGVICRTHLLPVFWKLIKPFHSHRATEMYRPLVRGDGRKGCSAMQSCAYNFLGQTVLLFQVKETEISPRVPVAKFIVLCSPKCTSNLKFVMEYL